MSNVIDFAVRQHNRDRLHDLADLFESAPLNNNGERPLRVLMRRLKPIEQAAWSAFHPRFALVWVLEETADGFEVMRSMVLLPDDRPTPETGREILATLGVSARVRCGPAEYSFKWRRKCAEGGAA